MSAIESSAWLGTKETPTRKGSCILGTLASKSASQNSFFNTASNDEDQLIAHTSMSDKMDVFGGGDVLKEDLISVTPKNMILWGVLILGSLLLLFMAFSMLKSTSKGDVSE